MLWSNLEYIALRLLRRHLFTEKLLARCGRFIPYYRCNYNQVDPRPVVDLYERFLGARGLDLAGKRILEVGAGATNSTGYEMSRRFPGSDILLLEPFADFDPAADAKLLAGLSRGPEIAKIKERVRRLTDFAEIRDQSIEVILSHSVLEHVDHPRAFFQELQRVLAPDGVMLHIADYRDHFFKYPYHFLQFSKKFWNRYLNPGDLPGWRLGDHLAAARDLGLKATILEEQTDTAAFTRIWPYISSDYDPDDPHLAAAQVVLYLTREA